jgi:hypothetical protein
MIPFLYVALIGVIYCLAQLLKRRKKMSNRDHDTFGLIIDLIVAWSVVFFGIWGLPITYTERIAIDFIDSFGFVVLAIAYFSHKRMMPWTRPKYRRFPPLETPNNDELDIYKSRAYFGIVLSSIFLQAGLCFALAIRLWNIATINGIQIITYSDMASLGLLAIGLSLVYFAVRICAKRYAKAKTVP